MHTFNRNCARLVMLVTVFVGLCAGPVTLVASELRVYPRIITPGTPPFNEKAFFDFTELDDVLPRLSIYALGGSKVCSISTANPQVVSAGWRVCWSGKDEEGNLVSPGVYLYQFEQNNTVVTGTIVVAR